MVRKPHVARYIPSPATTPALATDEATSRVPVCREGTSLAVGTSNVGAAFRPVLEVIALSSLDPFSVRLGCAQACLKETQRDEKRGDLNHCNLFVINKMGDQKEMPSFNSTGRTTALLLYIKQKWPYAYRSTHLLSLCRRSPRSKDCSVRRHPGSARQDQHRLAPCRPSPALTTSFARRGPAMRRCKAAFSLKISHSWWAE